MKKLFDERSSRSTWTLCALVCTLFLVTLGIRVFIVLSYSPDYGAVEMNVIYGIQRILGGQPLYQDPELPSYAIMQYMPLHYYSIAWLAGKVNIQWLELQYIYILGRAFSLVLNLITVAILFTALRKLKFSLVLSLISSLSVLIILTWHYYLRNDSSHLLFFVGSIYFALRYATNKRALNIVFAAVASAFCVMSKQNGILIVAIIGFYLFFVERRYRHSILYISVFFLCTAGLLLILVGTDLNDFYRNAYLGLKNGISIRYFNRNYFFLIPCFALWGVIIYLFSKKWFLGSPLKFIIVGGTTSFLFAAVTCIKLGSDINYFVEFLVFLLLAVPYCLSPNCSRKVIVSLKIFNVTLSGFTIFTLAFLTLYKTGTLAVSKLERDEREVHIASKSMGISAMVKVDKRRVSTPEEYKRSERLLRYFRDKLSIKRGENVFVYFLFIPERNFLDNLFIEYSIMPTKDVVSQVVRSSAETFDYSSFISGQNRGLIQYIVSEPGRDIFEYNEYLPLLHFDKDKFKWIKDVEGFSIYKYQP